MGIRTPDLFHAMEARYQLRHSPLQVPVELSASEEWLEPPSAALGRPVALGGLVALLLGAFAPAGGTGWGGAGRVGGTVCAAAGRVRAGGGTGMGGHRGGWGAGSRSSGGWGHSTAG